MKSRKHASLNWKTWLMASLISVITQSASASPEQERVYLLQLLHQIDAMQPTLLAAAKEQSKDARIQFHYTAYRDAEGQLHHGISEDLQLIRSGIEEQLNHSQIEPRSIPPVSGDYFETDSEWLK